MLCSALPSCGAPGPGTACRPAEKTRSVPSPNCTRTAAAAGILAPDRAADALAAPEEGNSRRSLPGGMQLTIDIRSPGCLKRPSGTTADTVPLPAPGRPGHARRPQSPRPAAPPGHPPASPWPSGYTAPQRPDHQSGAPAAMSKLPRPAPPARPPAGKPIRPAVLRVITTLRKVKFKYQKSGDIKRNQKNFKANSGVNEFPVDFPPPPWYK